MKLLAAVVLAAIALVILYGSVQAARTQASCWFSGGWLFASGLPTTYPVGVTVEPLPTGIGTGIPVNPDGTFSRAEFPSPAAYFWVRGHGPSLFKAGKQLNDYHVICEAHA